MATDPEVIFISGVAVSGFLNGVVNLALETAQFLPETVFGEGSKEEVTVGLSTVVTANLRFDLRAAQQIRDALDAIIETNTKPKVEH